MDETQEIIALLAEKVQEGQKLLDNLSRFQSLNGKAKLERRIQAEIKFLQKVIDHNQP